jgi:hypothetical protein
LLGNRAAGRARLDAAGRVRTEPREREWQKSCSRGAGLIQLIEIYLSHGQSFAPLASPQPYGRGPPRPERRGPAAPMPAARLPAGLRLEPALQAATAVKLWRCEQQQSGIHK